MSVSFNIEGLAELERKLQKLSTRSGRKVLRKGTRAAATPIRKAIRAATPVGPTGNLKKSIDRRFKFYRGSTTDIAVIGPTWPAGQHGHLVEKGTKERSTKSGKSTGRVAGKPFVKPATDAVFAAAGKKGAEALRAAIEQEIKMIRGGG